MATPKKTAEKTGEKTPEKAPEKTAGKSAAVPTLNETASAARKTVETAAPAAPKSAPERAPESAAKTGRADPDTAQAAAKMPLAEVVKSLGDLQSLNKQNYEALVAAGDVAAKGFEAWQAEILAFARAQLNEGVAQSKALMQVKTLDQWLELNTGFVKGALDAYIRESSKLGELAWKSSSEAWAPLSGRVEKTIESYAKRFAA